MHWEAAMHLGLQLFPPLLSETGPKTMPSPVLHFRGTRLMTFSFLMWFSLKTMMSATWSPSSQDITMEGHCSFLYLQAQQVYKSNKEKGRSNLTFPLLLRSIRWKEMNRPFLSHCIISYASYREITQPLVPEFNQCCSTGSIFSQCLIKRYLLPQKQARSRSWEISSAHKPCFLPIPWVITAKRTLQILLQKNRSIF